MLSRRDFLTSTGTGFATLLLTPLIGACGGGDDDGTTTSVGPTNPTPSCDGAGETSTIADGHSHTLCVPASDLTAPPIGGVAYTTSLANGHDHTVALSQANLIAVQAGAVVTVTTSFVSGHTHGFAVQKTDATSTPIPSPSMPYSVY